MTSKLVIAAIAVVLVGGGAWYLMANGGSVPSVGGSSEMVSNESFSSDMSLAELQSRGGSWKCTFSSVVENSESSGTVYVAGERLRGDFESRIPQVGMTVESHMVRDGDYVYTWSSAMPQGFKIPVSVADSGSASGATAGEVFDSNLALSWRCNAWPTDEGMFVVPGNISFREIQ